MDKPVNSGEIEYEKGMEALKSKDYSSAYDYFRKAAEQGHADAQNQVGEFYYEGNQVSQNAETAFQRYYAAALNGSIKGAGNLGYCFATGTGTVQNYQKAVEWLTKAAEGGDADAMVNLGVRYLNGQGVAKDERKAYQWMITAIEHGATQGYLYAGEMHYYGLEGGGIPNYDKAFEMRSKAMEKGMQHRRLWYYLGEMCLKGKRTAKNNHKAKMYLCPSALQGDEDAIELLIKHDELFDANSMERFYNFIMYTSGEAIGNGDPKSSPDIALFALTRALREKGLTGYELIGVIASKLYELAIRTMGENDCVKINFWKLAKNGRLNKQQGLSHMIQKNHFETVLVLLLIMLNENLQSCAQLCYNKREEIFGGRLWRRKRPCLPAPRAGMKHPAGWGAVRGAARGTRWWSPRLL